MDNIVKDLQFLASGMAAGPTKHTLARAADEIERLRAELDGAQQAAAHRELDPDGAAEWASIRVENDRLRAERAWRPVETAPKDGTFVLTFTPSRVPQQCILRWMPGATREQSKWHEGDGRWYVFGPTHWQPLPAPPAAGEP